MTKPSLHQVRVYFEDTDFSGNVYHGAYVRFFERGRTEWLRENDIHHSELASDGLAFAVRHMEIDFERAAHIDDALTVSTDVISISGARVVLDQQISRDGTVLARAKVTVAVINGAGRAARMPKALLALFSSD